jgi:prepilin-type N-terminal cleavage/methylation domain-containing protein
MSAGHRRRPSPRPWRAPALAPDAGFTLTEVLVSMMVIGVVMATLTTFFANSMSIVSGQRGKQTAIQLAADGIDLVRAQKAADLLGGRAACAPAAPCPAPVAGVDLTGMREWDHPTGAAAPLPFGDSPVRATTYHRYWYVGKCWQPAGGGPCTTTTGAVELIRVVVAVAWTDKSCQRSTCSYATSTLVSAGTDPLFNRGADAPQPTVTVPAIEPGEVGVPVSVAFGASGGTPPLTLSATHLPTGLGMASNGVISGTPQEAQTPTVTVTAVDDFGNAGTASFTWTIVPPPKLADPGSQSTVKDVPVTLQLQRSGGIGPFTWSATNLPAGLSLDQNGLIRGKPTKTGPKDVTVTVTDKNHQSDTVRFRWQVVPRIVAPREARTDFFLIVIMQATADGTGPYAWSATDLPTGLRMEPDGEIWGLLVEGGRYLTTITVTDATGASSSVTFPWSIDNPLGPQITGPTGDRTGDTVGQQVTVPLAAHGIFGPYSWTATGLPPGVKLTGNALTGTPTQAGTYLVTLTAHGAYPYWGDQATFMFTWTVQ